MDIPKGQHNHHYHYIITVTNNAMLQTVATYDVSNVDIS